MVVSREFSQYENAGLMDSRKLSGGTLGVPYSAAVNGKRRFGFFFR